MKKLTLALFVLFALMAPQAFGLPDPPKNGDKEKKKEKKKLKDKLVDKVLDSAAKAMAKRMKYSRNDVFAGARTSSHTDLGSGVGGDYSGVLIKDANGDYRHLDGKKATRKEIKTFKAKYYKKTIIPDFTAYKWKTGTGTDPAFSHTIFDKPYGNLKVSGLDLHASFNMKTGKMTLKDGKTGIVYEGAGVNASAITSLTLIDIRGESKTVEFEKGDFKLKSKLVFALHSNIYVRGSTTDIAGLNGMYSRNNITMGAGANVRLSLPTDVTYKRVKFTVTPYVGAGAYTNMGGTMNYGMDWGGASRNNYALGSNSGAKWEAGVSVSISFSDAKKFSRGIIRSLTGR